MKQMLIDSLDHAHGITKLNSKKDSNQNPSNIQFNPRRTNRIRQMDQRKPGKDTLDSQSSPFYVKKKDGKLRPCQDYQYLNDWTIKNAYSLPLISELIVKLAGTKYFSKLDVQWGYNNIRIKNGDQWKAVFKMDRGLFELTVMFFGLCNSPATFQGMMDSIFEDLIEGHVS